MMKRLILIFLPFIIAFSSPNQSVAQFNRKQILKNRKNIRKFRGHRNNFDERHRYNYFGISINAFNYFGDITPASSATSTDISFTRPGYGVHFGHRFGPRYTLRVGFTYGTLSGDDYESADPYDESGKYRYVRNLQFRNRVKELSAVAIFDLWKNEGTYISRVKWTPYVLVGASVFHHNPQGKVAENSDLPEAGTWVNLQPLGTEGQFAEQGELIFNRAKPYSRIQLALIPGVGVRVRLNEIFDIAIESSARYTFTDYLDDVSGTYVNLEVLDSDLARVMSDRSGEEFAVISGEARDFEAVGAVTGNSTPGVPPGTYGGYGRDRLPGIEALENGDRGNRRGNDLDDDFFIVTSIKLSYIIGGSIRKAKFR